VDESFYESDGVVVGDRALVATGENAVELPRRATPGGLAVPRRDGESAVVVGHELGQEGAGSLERVDLAQPQFDDKTVLERLPQAFDAALGLRAEGWDVGDAKLLEGVAERSGFLTPLELFFHRPVLVVSFEDARAVTIHALGQSIDSERVAQDEAIAMEILVRAEDKAEDLSGGIVEGAHEIDSLPTILEPRERGAVDQNHGPEARLTLPSAAVLASAAAALGIQTQGAPYPPHGFPAHAQSLEIPKLFGNVTVVHPNLRALKPVVDPIPDLRRDPASGGPAAVPMAEPGCPQASDPFLHAPELTKAQARPFRSFSIRDPSLQCVF
jgi:hypothetical protein